LGYCRLLAKAQGGRIYARSKLGKGTTFFVDLRQALEGSASAPGDGLG
jgi:signal transduction histidine kinase